MKPVVFIVIAICLAIWFLPSKLAQQQDAVSVVQKTALDLPHIPAVPTTTPFIAKSVPPMSLDELRIVKGKVEKIMQDGIVFVCDLRTPPPQLNFPGNENSKLAMAPVLKFYDQEKQEYGEVKMLQNGHFFSEDWHGGAIYEDRVLVVDWPVDSPIAVGNKMRVGVAPTGETWGRLRVYTVKFPLKPGVSRRPPWKTAGFD